MTRLEFLTSGRIGSLEKQEFYDMIIEKINQNRILVIEKDLDPMEKMELIAHGLEYAKNGLYPGIKMLEISVSVGSHGFLRNNHKDIIFNLITPGSSEIDQKEDGHYSITTTDQSGSSEQVVSFL